MAVTNEDFLDDYSAVARCLLCNHFGSTCQFVLRNDTAVAKIQEAQMMDKKPSNALLNIMRASVSMPLTYVRPKKSSNTLLCWREATTYVVGRI